MATEKGDTVSVVASGLLQSDLESQLADNVKSGDGDKPDAVVTRTVSVKKVRLTPSKILSMVRKGSKKSKVEDVPELDGEDDLEDEDSRPARIGRKKKHKKDVKEAIFGPGDFKKKLRRRGSSTDAEDEKKPKRRRRKKPKPPPPPPPPPKKKKTPKKKTPPPPPKEPTPKEPTPKEPPPETPVKEKTETPAPSEPPPPPPPPAQAKKESVVESIVVAQERKKSKTRTKSKSSSLCCPPDSYSLWGRLKWLMVLIYHGPIQHLILHLWEATTYTKEVLGPTFDSIFIEYLKLLGIVGQRIAKGHNDQIKQMSQFVGERDTDDSD